MVDAHLRLASFAPRPPTPPKERTEKSAKFEQDSIQSTARLSGVLDTPEDSPSSSAEYFGGSSERVSKRVIFSPWTKYHRPLGDSGKNNDLNNQIRVLPPSRDCKSSKSILKPYLDIYTSASTGDLSTLGLGGDITTMLESATQHLGSPSRNSRVDAYTALLGFLSTYDDIPDLQTVSDKFLKLLRCIRRDVLARNEEHNCLDTQLATQALKLLTVLVSMPDLVGSLPDDFCSFIIEQSISSLEDRALPKIVVTHYMHFIMQHKLSRQHMNTDRMNRLIIALDGVAGNIKGNRIVAQRLMVYTRLLTQAKPAMISCVGTWIGHLISGMLSTFKDIRSRAIMFGMEASLLLGTIRSVSQAFTDTLNRESPEGKNVVDFLATRLTEMANSKDDGIHVPQIWSIVILFLRSRRHQLEGWQHLKPWLLIILKCFNSSDTHIKFQANLAWSRLIFAVNLDSSPSSTIVKMLRQPIAPQLDRKSDLRAYKTSKHNKQIARSSYCTLLYYAFRPSATHSQFDQYWDEYISQMLPSDPSINILDVNHSCNILTALFSSPQPKIWDENRANANGPVKADELPCIDPKWVRSRAPNILKIFERLFQAADWQSRKDQEAPILLAWQSFATAIGEAGRKEVKVSMETMTAIAHILNTIKQFWLRDMKQNNAERMSHVIEKTGQLFDAALSKIGPIPFNEKRLIQTSQNSYEATETPSNRSSKSRGPMCSSFVSLLNLLVSTLEDFQIPQNYESVIEHLINISMPSTTSRRTQISILRDFARLIPPSSCLTSRAKVIFWQLIAKSARSVFGLPNAREPHDESPQYTGHDYKDAIKILEVGVFLRFAEISSEWQDLVSILVQALEQEIGDEGATVVLVKPLAEAISQSQPANCNAFLLNSATLLKSTKWSYLKYEKECAYKLLWGVSPVANKQSCFDPLNSLYPMVELLLKNSYADFKSISSNVIVDFLLAVTSMIDSCPSSLVGIFLKQIQEGVAAWIEDVQEVMNIPNLGDDSANIYSTVKHLWATISSIIKTLPEIDSQLLLTMNTLISSSLSSRHKAIVNESVLLWNCTFGLVEDLQYPDNLQPVLLKLRTLTCLNLPNLENFNGIEVPSSPIRLVDSQSDEELMQRQHHDTSFSRTPRSFYETKNDSTTRISRSSPHPELQRPGVKTTPKRNIYHDDYQIQFAAKEQSPLVSEIDDAQLLINRRNETGKHQDHEARNRNIDKSPPKLCFKDIRYHQPNSNLGSESPSVPGNESSNDFVGSSPTPISTKPSGGSDHMNEPPSPSLEESPTELGTRHDANFPRLNKTAQSMLECCDRSIARNNKLQVRVSGDEGLRLDPKCSDGDSNRTVEMHWKESVFSEHTNSLLSTNELDKDMTIAHALPEADEFSSAPSKILSMSESDTHRQPASAVRNLATPQHLAEEAQNPVLIEETKALSVLPYTQDTSTVEAQGTDTSKQENRVDAVTNSFKKFEVGCFPNEDDQIAAQLERDLELAFSQAESGTTESSPVSESIIPREKRKRAFNNSANAVKRLKLSPKAQNFQILVKAQKLGETEGYPVVSDTEDGWDLIPIEVESRQTRSQSSVKKTNTSKSNVQRKLSRNRRSSTPNSPSSRKSRAISESDPLDSSMNSEPIDDVWNTASSVVGKGAGSARLDVLAGNDDTVQLEPTERVCGISMDMENTGIQRERSPSRSFETSMSSTQKCEWDVERVQGSVSKEGNGSSSPQHDPIGNVSVIMDEAQTTLQNSTLPLADDAGREEQPDGQRILDSLRSLLEDLKQTTLGAKEEKEMIGLLCHSLQEVHEAGRRKKLGVE